MMMRPLLISACAALLLTPLASAGQLIEARDGNVINGHVSSSGVTRISFIEDQAASVQLAQGGDGPGFSIAHEPNTGDLYLTLSRDPYRGEAPGAASFFVTTQQGFTYQVELAARDIPSTQIEIRNPQLQTQKLAASVENDPLADQIVSLTRAMWTGALLDGYQVKQPLKRERAAGTLRLTPIAEYEGPGLTGRVLQIRNPSPGIIELSEDVFMAPGVVSVTMKGPRFLDPGAHSLVLIVDQGGIK